MSVFQIQKDDGLFRILKGKDNVTTPTFVSTVEGLSSSTLNFQPVILSERGIIRPSINFNTSVDLLSKFEEYEDKIEEWSILLPRLHQNYEKLKNAYREELNSFIDKIKQLTLPEAFGLPYDPINDPESYLLDILQLEPSVIALRFPAIEKMSARKLIEILFNTRKLIPPNIALYLAGGVPIGFQTLMIALGVDILDDGAAYRSAAKNISFSDGFYTKNVGNLTLKDLIDLNVTELNRDFKAIQSSISNNAIWTRIARDMHSFPNVASAVKIFSKEYLPLISKSRYSSFRSSRLNFTGDEGLYHPDVVKFHNQLLETYKIAENKKMIILLPCSAKKPYRESKSHKIFEKTIKKAAKRNFHQVEIWSLTSPIGVVPRDLESIYPPGFYDLPVTGDWSHEESQIMGTLLKKMISRVNEKVEVVIHVSEGYRQMVTFGTENIKSKISWIGSYATSREAQSQLSGLIESLFASMSESVRTKSKFTKDSHKEINTILQYVHGKNVYLDLRDTKTFGRPPRPIQVKRNNDHLLSWDQINGRVILAPMAALEIAAQSNNWILTDTDELRGSTLFNVGIIEASESISSGDEILIFNSNKQNLLGVGQAQISGYAMNRVDSGIAAKIKKKCVLEVIDK